MTKKQELSDAIEALRAASFRVLNKAAPLKGRQYLIMREEAQLVANRASEWYSIVLKDRNKIRIRLRKGKPTTYGRAV